MLLSENSSTGLTNEDITNLTRLLCASVKKSVGERIVPATDNRKQYYTKAQRVSLFSIATSSSIYSQDNKYDYIFYLVHPLFNWKRF